MCVCLKNQGEETKQTRRRGQGARDGKLIEACNGAFLSHARLVGHGQPTQLVRVVKDSVGAKQRVLMGGEAMSGVDGMGVNKNKQTS